MIVTSPASCRLDGCDGFLHDEGICAVELVRSSPSFGYVSFESVDDELCVSVSNWMETQATTQAEANALADRFRRFAAAIEAGGRRLGTATAASSAPISI